MRVFHITPSASSNWTTCPSPATAGFLWIGSARREFEVQASRRCRLLQRWTGGQLVDLHVSDLLNNQLPSTSTTPRGTTCWCSAAWPPAQAARSGCSSTTNHGTLATARQALAPSTPARWASPCSTACC
jgi:magnesium transporter